MTSIVDKRMSSLIYREGLRPEVYFVSPVSTLSVSAYSSTYSFGSGLTGTSLNGVTIPNDTNVLYTGATNPLSFVSRTCSTYRRDGDTVVFDINVDLDLTQRPPDIPTLTFPEVRIRNLQPDTTNEGNVGTPNTSVTYSRSLPPPSPNFMPPFFRDVQIYSLNTVNGNTIWDSRVLSNYNSRFSTLGATDLGARLLTDGSLALVNYNFNPSVVFGTESGLQYSDIFRLFGQSNPTGSTLRISLRGIYVCA